MQTFARHYYTHSSVSRIKKLDEQMDGCHGRASVINALMILVPALPHRHMHTHVILAIN